MVISIHYHTIFLPFITLIKIDMRVKVTETISIALEVSDLQRVFLPYSKLIITYSRTDKIISTHC